MQVVEDTLVLLVELLFGLGEGLSNLVTVLVPGFLISLSLHLKQLELLL